MESSPGPAASPVGGAKRCGQKLGVAKALLVLHAASLLCRMGHNMQRRTAHLQHDAKGAAHEAHGDKVKRGAHGELREEREALQRGLLAVSYGELMTKVDFQRAPVG